MPRDTDKYVTVTLSLTATEYLLILGGLNMQNGPEVDELSKYFYEEFWLVANPNGPMFLDEEDKY